MSCCDIIWSVFRLTYNFQRFYIHCQQNKSGNKKWAKSKFTNLILSISRSQFFFNNFCHPSFILLFMSYYDPRIVRSSFLKHYCVVENLDTHTYYPTDTEMRIMMHIFRHFLRENCLTNLWEQERNALSVEWASSMFVKRKI